MEVKCNKEISPGKNIGVLLACVGMGSGKIRHVWSLELVTELEEPQEGLLREHWSEKEELRKYTHPPTPK